MERGGFKRVITPAALHFRLIPGVTGVLGVDLGYSRDPNYHGGSFGGFGMRSGSYIVQRIDPQAMPYTYCRDKSPCLDILPYNPCAK